MDRLLVAAAPDAGSAPGARAAAWNADAVASAVAQVEAAGGKDFFPGLELVVVPLGVNLAPSLAYDLVRRLAGRLRAGRGDELQVERAGRGGAAGGVVIVVRAGGRS